MASQVACPRRKSLNFLPAKVSLTTSLIASAVYERAAPQEEQVVEVAEGLGPCGTAMSIDVVLPGASKEDQLSP